MTVSNKTLIVNQKLLLDYLPERSWLTEQHLADALGLSRRQLRYAKQSLIDSGKLVLELLPNGRRSNPVHQLRKVHRKVNPMKKVTLYERSESVTELVGLHLWMDIDRLQQIEFYHKSGLFICPAEDKKPVMSRRRWLKNYPTLESVLEYFDKYPDKDVGHWNFTWMVLDHDSDDDFVQGRTTPTDTLTVKTNRGRHQYFQSFADQRCTTKEISGSIDTKCNGAFLMLPPSRNYSWDNLARPKATPTNIQQFFQSSPTTLILEGQSQEHKMKLEEAFTQSGYRLPSVLPEGTRHDNLFKYGRSMKAQGFPASHIRAELHRVNDELCQPRYQKRYIDELLGKLLALPNRADFEEQS